MKKIDMIVMCGMTCFWHSLELKPQSHFKSFHKRLRPNFSMELFWGLVELYVIIKKKNLKMFYRYPS